MGIIEKALKKLEEKQELNVKDYKRELSYIRLDNNDMEDLIRELKERGHVSLQTRRHKGKVITFRRRD